MLASWAREDTLAQSSSASSPIILASICNCQLSKRHPVVDAVRAQRVRQRIFPARALFRAGRPNDALRFDSYRPNAVRVGAGASKVVLGAPKRSRSPFVEKFSAMDEPPVLIDLSADYRFHTENIEESKAASPDEADVRFRRDFTNIKRAANIEPMLRDGRVGVWP